MSLKMKTVKDFMESMTSWISSSTTKITDFNVGSATRTVLEAVAIQLEELYYKMYAYAIWAIENSVYKAFSYDRADASKATGMVRLEFYQPLPGNVRFEKGLEFSKRRRLGTQVYYESTEDITVTEGSTFADIPVKCAITGTLGNTPSNSVTIMTTPSSYVMSVYNPNPIAEGTEQETLESRKLRFDTFIKSLAKANKDSVEYGVSIVPGVQGFWVESKGFGITRIYAHNSNGELPPELALAIKESLVNYVAAGVEAIVVPVDKVLVDVSVRIRLARGMESQKAVYETIVIASLTQFLEGMTVSKDLDISDIVHHIRLISPDIVSVEVLLPEETVTVLPQQLIRPNSINVTVIV